MLKKILITVLLVLGVYGYSIEFNNEEDDLFIYKIESDITEINSIKDQLNSQNTILENYLKLKNRETKREVIILKNKDSYNEYLQSIEADAQSSYIYIKYSNNKGALVIFIGDDLDIKDLNYNATMQYIDFYTPNAPLWFKSALATYYQEESTERWVEFIKSSRNFKSVMTTTLDSSEDNLKPYLLWGIVDYLINSDNKEHNRLLWDTLSFLKYNPSLEGSEEIINTNFNIANLNSDISEYINTLKNYTDYMTSGINLYNSNKYNQAILEFKNAISKDSSLYSPFYYIGLSYNKLNNFNEAYSNFTKALDLGAPTDIVYYSIGVNFFQQKDYKQAKNYLEKIEGTDYKDRAEEVLYEIEKY